MSLTTARLQEERYVLHHAHAQYCLFEEASTNMDNSPANNGAKTTPSASSPAPSKRPKAPSTSRNGNAPFPAKIRPSGRAASSSSKSSFLTVSHDSLSPIPPPHIPPTTTDIRYQQHRIPHQTPEMQIHPTSLPPQRLPLRHRLPQHPQRRRRLETRHHHQRDPPRNPIPPRRSQPRESRAGRGV